MDDLETKSTSRQQSIPESQLNKSRRRFTICIVSDFFLPRLGGVELHQFEIAQRLIKRGHRVIVVTGTYGNNRERQGIRYLAGNLKVYYCPQIAFHNQVSVPTLFSFLPLFRNILLRERVDIVHGHQTTSPLAHECLLQAGLMGYRTVFTDHSLFGIANAAAIHVNKVLQFSLCGVDHTICVSHTLRENIVLRTERIINPSDISVIPNALTSYKFTPDLTRASRIPQSPQRLHSHPPTPRSSLSPSTSTPSDRINIVVVSRLAYRKGLDLVIDLIPRVCLMDPRAYFIIGGDGPKMLKLKEVIEVNRLHDRVELLGEVPHDKVRDVLIRGDIFLNCSLTESFCIAVLEAVSCGLQVVSTRVGGLPEILPADVIRFAEPEVSSLLAALSWALEQGPLPNDKKIQYHQFVKNNYVWDDIAERTEIVYNRIMGRPPTSIYGRINKYFRAGPFAGKIFAGVQVLGWILSKLFDQCHRADQVDTCIDVLDLDETKVLMEHDEYDEYDEGGEEEKVEEREGVVVRMTRRVEEGNKDETRREDLDEQEEEEEEEEEEKEGDHHMMRRHSKTTNVRQSGRPRNGRGIAYERNNKPRDDSRRRKRTANSMGE